MTRSLLATSVALALAFSTAAVADQAGTTVLSPWARATPPGARVGAAYFTVHSGQGDVLISANSDVAERVELHAHSMDAGVMRMRPTANIPIAAGPAVTFEPGGYHVMLIDLKQPLKLGGTVPVALTFQRAGTVIVQAEIKPVGARNP